MGLDNLAVIKFEINKMQLTMPNLLKQNYMRMHVLQLFEELQKKGFGVYTLGRRGPGNCAKFDPNDKCPLTYSIVIDPKAGKIANKVPDVMPPKASGKAPTEPPKVMEKQAQNLEKKSESDDADEKTAHSHVLHSLLGLSKNLVKNPASTFVGYECIVFADQILVLYRVRGGGYETIESAVKQILPSIDNRILVNETRETTRLEAIVSLLKGVGILVLCPEGCTCGGRK